MRKLPSEVSDQVILKLACSDIKARKSLEILGLATTDDHSNKNRDQTTQMCRHICLFIVHIWH